MHPHPCCKFVLAVGLIILTSRCVDAEVITVNTTAMDVADDGFCSLPEAIVAANEDTASGISIGECAAGNGADSIELGMFQTYTLTTVAYTGPQGPDGLPRILSDIRINGHGSTVQRDPNAPQFRIFEITELSALNLNGVNVAHGHAADGFYPNGHGAEGGCFFNLGDLTLQGVSVSECHAGDADGSGAGGAGGAIYTVGNLTMLDGGITNSTAGAGNLGGGGSGGAIASAIGTATIEHTSIVANKAGASSDGNGGNGGGIFNDSATLVVTDSLISVNSAAGSGGGFSAGEGGGIFNNFGTVTLVQSTVSSNSAGSGSGSGGNGGGIASYFGPLSASGCTFEQNHAGGAIAADSGGYGGSGGAIYSSGYLELTTCSLRGNSAGPGGPALSFSSYGGHGGDGGALLSTAAAVLYGCVVDGNSSGPGGGGGPNGTGGEGGGGAIVSYSGSLGIEDTTISNNAAGNGGGASGNGSGGPGGRGGGVLAQGSLQMRSSALIGNHAGKGGTAIIPGNGGNGGGLSNDSNDALIGNVTVTANQAGDGGDATANTPGGQGGTGGGVANTGYVEMFNVTVNANSAGLAGAAPIDVPGDGDTGGLYSSSGTIDVGNSIIANSQVGFDCSTSGTSLIDAGGNLVKDGTCFGAPTNPSLGLLAFNGGPTMTHRLCSGFNFVLGCFTPSPAIDYGDTNVCQYPPVSLRDQRGATRPSGSACDSGAFESGATTPIVVGSSATTPGGTACVPVSLASGSPTMTTNLLAYDPTLITTKEVVINPAIGLNTTPDKKVFHAPGLYDTEVFSVVGPSMDTIPTGLLYTARLSVDPATPPGTYPLEPGGAARLTVTTCAGDCDGNGTVSLSEAQRCVNMFLGAPACDFSSGAHCSVADANGDGTISIGELQQCANHLVNGC